MAATAETTGLPATLPAAQSSIVHPSLTKCTFRALGLLGSRYTSVLSQGGAARVEAKTAVWLVFRSTLRTQRAQIYCESRKAN